MSFAGGLKITRYAKPEFAEALRSDRPDCVMLNWRLESKNKSPSEKDDEIEKINIAISEVTKSGGNAVLVISTIGQTRGIWVFYSSEGKSLAAALEEKLSGKTKAPTEVRVVADPKWNGFRNYLARLRQSD